MDASLPPADASAELDAAPADAAFSDLDSPYMTHAAMQLATALCRECETLRCGDDAAPCAIDPACVIAAQCLTTCTDASCAAACTHGD